MTAIVAEQLTKRFPPAIDAVADIDLSIERGQVFGFLGPNGSGKTTTVRMLTTLLRPTSGRASVDGLDVTRHSSEVRRRIGVALQAAQAGFLVFFPLLCLSPAFAPKEVFAGWLEFLATINPVTYVLQGMRSLILDGWDIGSLAAMFGAIASIGGGTLTLTLAALRSRVR